MENKEELKGLLATAKNCIEKDRKEGLKNVIKNIEKIIN